MPDYSGFVDAIKVAARDAVDATNPMQVTFGTVVSASPLKIRVSQKLTLNANALMLTSSVIDHEYQSTINGIMSPVGACSADNVTTLQYSGLRTGEKVLLLRMQGGQKYIVLDRVVG